MLCEETIFILFTEDAMRQSCRTLFCFCLDCSPSKRNNNFFRICRNRFHEIIFIGNGYGLVRMNARDTSKKCYRFWAMHRDVDCA